MKKSTKLITTAVAMVLVLGVMVVGILAATSASAAISANVSWTATEGLDFKLVMESYIYSTENTGDSIDIDVDTTTTNDQATGISESLNLTFNDPSPDDGVNNPEPIYLICQVVNRTGTSIEDEYGNFGAEGGKTVTMTFTSTPQVNDSVEITYATFGFAMGMDFDYKFFIDYINEDDREYGNAWSSTAPTLVTYPQVGVTIPPDQLCIIKLTVKNPDVSFSGVDLNWGLSFSQI